MKIALLGTGRMGAAIARRLAGGGHELTIWNRTPERARAVGAGTVAASAAGAAAAADVVLSVLYDEASVRDVYAHVEPRAGQVYCEMSTAGLGVAEDLAPRLEAAGARLLCTPIMGSVPAIEQGTALILAGGDEAAFEQARPALEAFGEPEHAGSYRDAMGLKLLNNAMLGACGAVASELLAASRRAGLDLDATFRLLTRMMPYLNARRRGYLGRDHEATLFELTGMVKDMDLALDLGRGAGASMPMTAVARELYAMAEPAHGEEELSAVIEVFPA